MPKIPKPPAGYEFMGRKLGPKKLKRPVAGRDTRPTERESMSGMPRKRKSGATLPRMPKYMPSKPRKPKSRMGY